jgi:hypothetical protein
MHNCDQLGNLSSGQAQLAVENPPMKYRSLSLAQAQFTPRCQPSTANAV